MRVIAGKHRSRILLEFEGREIRPTTDRVKESLFNILQNKTPGAEVLDLFCGSGNLGIEAISRGAKSSVFVDSNKKSIALTNQNLKNLKEEAETFNYDATNYLNLTDKKFDIIFLDPPYKSEKGAETLKIISEKDILKDGGIAVFESDHFPGVKIDGLEKYDERKYGIVHLSFYRREA